MNYVNSLMPINPKKFTAKEFGHLLGQPSYVAHGTRPDIAHHCARLLHIHAKESTVKDATELNKVLQTAKDKIKGISFPNLDMSAVCIRGYADAGFATNEDQTSQLGMVIELMDGKNNVCILHYASWKSNRVVRSPLAAEVYGLTAFHDYCFTLVHELNRMLGGKIPTYLLTDSISIFDTITNLTNF